MVALAVIFCAYKVCVHRQFPLGKVFLKNVTNYTPYFIRTSKIEGSIWLFLIFQNSDAVLTLVE